MRHAAERLKQIFGDCASAIWPAWLLASVLILWGFAWSLPHGPHVDKSFHADENAALWGIRHIHFPTFNPHVFTWGTALFYQVYAVRLLVSLGGAIPVGTSGTLLIARMIVWFYALGTLACLYKLCREIFDEWTSRLAPLLLAAMPAFVINSHYFKTDIPMLLWMVAAVTAGYRFMAAGEVRYAYALGLLTGYSISTKYSAATIIPLALFCVAMAPAGTRKFRAILIFVICMAAAFLFGTPRVLPDPREFLDSLKAVAAIGKASTPVAAARGAALKDYLTRISELSMTIPIWLAAIAGLAWVTARRTRMVLPMWGFLIAYAFLLKADNIRLSRYIVRLLPFAALAIAGMLGEVRRMALAGRIAATAVAGVLIAFGFLFTASWVRAMTAVDPRIRASDWISGHVSTAMPFPVSTSHYIGAPQVQLWGFDKLEIKTDVRQLKSAASPYVAVSEYVTQHYAGALSHYPDVREFFDYIDDNYTEVAHFENSQRLLWIDSKCGDVETHDWLYPNPRITVFKRRDAGATGPRPDSAATSRSRMTCAL